jgi:hypothetical protein
LFPVALAIQAFNVEEVCFDRITYINTSNSQYM